MSGFSRHGVSGQKRNSRSTRSPSFGTSLDVRTRNQTKNRIREIRQRNNALVRRIGRRVGTIQRVRNPCDRAENVAMSIAGADRQGLIELNGIGT